MKYRLSSIAAVTFGAVLSALIMVAHPAQAQNCASVEVQNIRPEQGMLHGWSARPSTRSAR